MLTKNNLCGLMLVSFKILTLALCKLILVLQFYFLKHFVKGSPVAASSLITEMFFFSMMILALQGFFIKNLYGIWIIYLFSHCKCKVKLATIVEGDPKAPFSVATTLRFREGLYSFPWIASLYPWYVPYNAEC